MIKRRLGRTGIEITEIGLGTNYVGGHNLYQTVDESEGLRLVRQALDEGINFFDTADAYGDGRCEELLGKALAGRAVVLATKGGIVPGKRLDDPSRYDNTPAYLRAALEASLKRLGRDDVDLYYIHRSDGRTPPDEAFGALLRFKQEGLIRAAGVSNFTPAQIRAAMKAGPIDSVQARYNIFQREVERETLFLCEKYGISFIPWGPLAFGLLGGRYARDFKLPAGDWRARTGLFDAGAYERNLDVVEKLKAIAAHKGVAPPLLAIRWLLCRPAVASVIAGAKNADQVRQNALAQFVELAAEDIAAIAALTA